MRRTEDWQKRVLAYAKSIPEVKHAGLFVNNTMSQARIAVEGDERVAQVIEEMLVSFPMGRVCRNLFYVGDVIVAFDKRNFRWQSFGKNDYRHHDNKPLEVKNPDGKFRELDENWVWFRIYREDDDDRFAATSAHHAMLDLLESMYLHQLADATIAQSRLAGAGILYIPNDEFLDGPDQLDGGEPEPGTTAHFEKRLRDAMNDSLRDRRQQDALVPLVMFGGAEYADAIKHVLLERNDDAKGFADRMDAYRERYGDGVDLPKEVVVGMGEANHWGAWKVDQNTWQYYLKPLGQIAVDALTEKFVRPIAEALGSTAKFDATLDATAVIVKPDRTDAAIRLYSQNALSAEAALREAGFNPETDLHPLANQGNGSLGQQPDGQVRMPSANFRGSEGQPVSDRNFER